MELDKITHNGKTVAEIVRLHGLWLIGDKEGFRADLSGANLLGANLLGANLLGANLSGANLLGANLLGANLSGANLTRANLSGTDLSGADLTRANLSGANLWYANLSGANLTRANLSGTDLTRANLSGANLWYANLSGANLTRANLSGTDLSGANLSRANLSGANLSDANLSGANNISPIITSQLSILPDEGDVIGWKKCKSNVIVKLRIPSDAKRSNATGRKCRAEYADVLEVIGADVGISSHDGKTKYLVGQRVTCDKWGEDRWIECAGGIHFFITRIEAENY